MTKNEFRQVVNFQSECIRRQKTEIERLHEVINGFEEQSHKELVRFMDLSEKYVNAKEEIEKIKKDLKYYLDTNEENGVVWIPKFTVDNLVKEMTEQKG